MSHNEQLFRFGAVTMLMGGISLMAASGALVWMGNTPAPPPAEAVKPTPAQACALPSGLDLDALSQTAADRVAGRAALCVDFEAGRIDSLRYDLGLNKLNKAALPPLPSRLWATQVIGSSSEYSSDSWSAKMVLGPADVYPKGGDNGLAWASQTQNDEVEFLEVTVPTGRVSAVEVYETFNPGAVSGIELVTKNGTSKQVYSAQAGVMNVTSYLRTVPFSCTDEEVVAVRVTLDATAVPGWNEIDAIAVRPCR